MIKVWNTGGRDSLSFIDGTDPRWALAWAYCREQGNVQELQDARNGTIWVDSSEPASNYVNPDRQTASALGCGSTALEMFYERLPWEEGESLLALGDWCCKRRKS